MTNKRPASAALRRLCFETHKRVDFAGRIYLLCHICKGPIRPASEPWEAEHIQRRVLSNDDSASNLAPAHVKCHREKTRTDVAENAKGKRSSDRHFGIRRRGWGGKVRKKMSGEIVEK